MTQFKFALFAAFGILLALPRVAYAAPDDTLGMALMSATVSGQAGAGPPILIRGSGVVSVGPSVGNPGHTYVAFDRDISTCTCAASVGHYDLSSIYNVGYAVANCPNSTNKTALVITRLPDGTFAFFDFNLIVFCPK